MIPKTIKRAFLGWPNFERQAEEVYKKAVQQSRLPVFYQQWGVEDSIDGRFDMLCMHIVLIMMALKSEVSGKYFNQDLFDVMFWDIENDIRLQGVGDLSVAPRMKKMFAAFNGRRLAYEKAFADNSVEQALANNVYRGRQTNSRDLADLATYMVRQKTFIESQDKNAIMRSEISFLHP